ncbi:MAG: hypothetical protein ACRDGS_16455, partial [Chloroflexota bacterium]
EQLERDPAEPYRDLCNNLRLDCLAHLARWQDIWPVVRAISRPDDPVFCRAALGAIAAGKVDVAERLLARIEDQQCLEARSLATLLGPIRQSQRASEVRRQQQIDQSEKQRWTVESRDLRRRIRDLEQYNGELADDLDDSKEMLQRVLEQVGALDEDSADNWDEQLKGLTDRAHRGESEREMRQAEQRLIGMLGESFWNLLSEGTRKSLREGELLYETVGDERDYGAAFLEYARGLEGAYKDAIFFPARARWAARPDSAGHLQVEEHDPSLGPFVRFVLRDSHLTLGRMATALDRMGDVRRLGVAVGLLRKQLGIDPRDERKLTDWKRTAERLQAAAEARNRPAHAASVNRESVRAFREMVLGTDGLLRALARG